MNFHTAVKPQITKYYASDEKDKMISLVLKSSKYSYYILFILSMPVLLETNYIFIFWLKNVSAYMVPFTRLIIVSALIDSLSHSLLTAAQATGKIKLYQVVVGGILLLNLPISYILLKSGFQPQATLYVSIIFSIICLFLRLWMLRQLVKLSILGYIKKVIMRVLAASIIASIIPLFIITRLDESFTRFIIICSSGLIASIVAIYIIGLSRIERKFLIQVIQSRFAI
jgi:O-antigen/teichoic acid export membrane protein